MLKMLCQKCHEMIISDLLAEIDEITCPHCHESVPIHNILISSRGMTISRDELLKRFFRYKKLLMDVVEERALMESNAEITENSKKSADHFIRTLEEIMAGARDHFRLQFSLSVPIRIRFDGKVQSGWLVNLSMVGACIETENYYFLPHIGDIIHVDFSVPGKSGGIQVESMVAWVKECQNGASSVHDIGVKFMQVSDKMRMDLWHLISTSVHQVFTGQGDERHIASSPSE